MRMAMRLRLGLPILAPAVPCVCRGQVLLARDSTHPLHCRSAGGLMTFRHDTVKQLLAEIAQLCGASTQIEPRHVLYSDQRHPDVAIVMGAAQLSVDVTIRYPLSPTYIPRIAQDPLGTAIRAEREKMDRYAAEARAQGVTFVPFALEATGGWGPAAVRLARELAMHASAHTHLTRQEAFTLCIQGLSVAVQRGNVLLLNGSFQTAATAGARTDGANHGPL